MAVASGAPASVEALVHPALFYRGEDEYLAGTVPFVRQGLAAGEPVAVAVPPANLATLAGELGADSGLVRFFDMTQVGRNPGRIIPNVLRAFADAHPDSRVRVIGEPIWPGRSEVEYPACAQHEALINAAFAGRNVSILCPYDAAALDPAVLADAEVTHPVLIDMTGERVSGGYGWERVVSLYNRPLPPPPSGVATMRFDRDTFPPPRRFVADAAARIGLERDRIDDLELMVSELVGNSLVHGGGRGTLRIWADGGQLACEVSDSGQLTDPLAGRLPAAPDAERGRGLLLVNGLADLVRVHTGEAGTTVRMYLVL